MSTTSELQSISIKALLEAFTKIENSLDKSSYKWPETTKQNIRNVKFKINRENKRVKCLGRCWHKKGYFEVYPQNHQGLGKEEFIDTVLHEYAHYLTYLLYETSGHNSEWKQICRIIGCRPLSTM